MPYKSINELPEGVRKIPAGAQKIYLAAFNSAFNGTCKGRDDLEACCAKVAWGAVKKSYTEKAGKWVKLESIISTLDPKDPDPVFSGDIVTLPICKVGTKAVNIATGETVELTGDALQEAASSWGGGIISVNHQRLIEGSIAKSWYQEPYVMASIKDLTQDARDAMASKAYRGVSQESIPLEISGGKVKKLRGTGVTIAFYPYTPACKLAEGCGVPVVSTLEDISTDGEKHRFDIGVMNNAGKIVKVKDLYVWIDTADADNEEKIQKRIIQDLAWDGIANYYVYNSDPGLQVGDEIPADQERVYKINITVSLSDILLNSRESEDTIINPTGGVYISEDIKKLTLDLEAKDKEIASLKSTVEDLKATIQSNDTKLQSTIEASVKAALDAHTAQIQAATAKEAIMAELKSCMPEDVMETFLKSDPSIPVIRSTIDVIKATAGKNVGAAGGSGLQSFDEKTDYAALGCTSITFEEPKA